MDSGYHYRGKHEGQLQALAQRSTGAAVLPSQHRLGDNGVALRDASISSFPSETLRKSSGGRDQAADVNEGKRSERK